MDGRQTSSGSGISWTARRCISPAVGASSSRWAERSCASRQYSSSTRRFATSRGSYVTTAPAIAAPHKRLGVTTVVHLSHDQVDARKTAGLTVVLGSRRGPSARRHADVYAPRADVFVARYRRRTVDEPVRSVAERDGPVTLGRGFERPQPRSLPRSRLRPGRSPGPGSSRSTCRLRGMSCAPFAFRWRLSTGARRSTRASTAAMR